MKKWIKIGVMAILAAIIFIAITYRVINQPPPANLTSEMQARTILETGGCLSCHSADGERPFYASFPIVGFMVKGDIEKGLKHEDLTKTYESLASGNKIDETILAKIEKVVTDGSMPLHRYYMIHWGASLNKEEKSMMLSWVKKQRETPYATGLACEEFANEPIQPIVDSIPVNPDKVELGKILFHDTRLSSDNTVSCASCHDLNTGGVDNKQYSEGVGGQFGGVNAPTVYNAAFNFVQFWDGRAGTLAEQAAGPPLNPVEMASQSFDDIIAKLAADKELTKRFMAIYPDGYSEKNITDAIEEFEKTLITPNSAFDRYLKGDKSAISQEAIDGYALFKENKCATCHVGVNLGGQSYEYMGLAHSYFEERNASITEEDNGRFKQTKEERDRHRFKVPGLRNIELTAPYFHDGSQKTMKDAVQYMAKYQLGDELKDNDAEKIVAFMNTLTGEFQGKKLTSAN